MKNSENNKQSIDDTALAYLEEKYGEKFKYAAPYGDHLSGTYEFLTTCNSLPGQKVLVQIDNYKRDEKSFKDNYIAVKYQQQTADFIQACAVKQFGEASVFYEVKNDGLSQELPATASFDEFLADTRVPLIILVEVRAKDYFSEDQAEKVGELFAACGAKFYLTIVVVDDDVFGTLDRRALNENISLRNFVRCVDIKKIGSDIESTWIGKE